MTAIETNTKHIEAHIPITASGKTALDCLAEHNELSKQKIKKALSSGAVWLESSIGIHRLRRAKKLLSENDTLHFYYDESILSVIPEPAELIADEGGYSIWNKPYGMYSQGSKWGDHCTIYRWSETHLKPERPAFLVHRLDRAATGLIILAHSKKMAKAFSAMFKNRQIKKQYKASIEGKLDMLILPYTLSSEIDGKAAISIITSAEHVGKKTSVTIEIKTGRKHQIRKHLSDAGYPIIGDRLYGSTTSEENLQLQSNYLKFQCPVSNDEKEYFL